MRHSILYTSFTLLALFTAGISLAEVDDTGTAGKTVTIADPAVTRTSDGLTGSGNLTLTTTGYTAGTASTYGTYQFNSGATTSGFTGGLVLNGANVDLNGTSLTVNKISTASNDKTASVTNTSATTATLTLSKSFNPYAQITGNVKVAWTLSGTTSLYNTFTNTAGTTLTGGEIYIVPGTAATNALGSGTLTLNGVKTNWSQKAYTQTAPLEITGNTYFRMSSGGSLDISGEISGSGNLIVSYDGANFTLSGVAKTYTGKTIIGSTGYCWENASAVAQLKLNAANILPSGTTVEMGSDWGGSTLALNGYSQTVKALKGTGKITSATAKTSTLTVTSTDVSGNFTLETGAVLALPAGTYTNLSTYGSGTLTLAGDTTITSNEAKWGVTKISAASDFSTAANPTDWTLTPTKLSATTAAEFPNNTTYSYSGYFLLMEETELSFLKNFDDTGCVWVTPVNEDGTLGTRQKVVSSGTGEVGTILYSGTSGGWDDVVVGAKTLSAGKWLIEARVGQGSGGVGPTYKYTDESGQSVLVPGIGVKAGANTDLAGVSAYKALNINSDSLELAGISTVLAVSANKSLGSNVQLAKGATLTLDAGTNAVYKISGNISGEGSKLVLTGQQGSEAKLLGINTHSGGTTVEVPKLLFNSSRALGSGTVTFNATSGTEVTFDSSVESTDSLLWKEGAIVKETMQTAETPASLVYTANASYTGKSPGNTTTWAYISDELVSDQNFTMYFGKMFDDAAYLKITDLTDASKTSVVINNAKWDAPIFGTYDFLEGHHYTIDLRVYNGTGGSGPVMGTSNKSGMPDGIGFGASTQGFTDGKGNDSFVLMNFDSTGALIGSALRGLSTTTFTQDFVLNSDVSFDASNATLQFDGKISGSGALTLKNGKFTLTSEGNSVGGLTLENASFGASKTSGVIQVTGDLNLTDSAISLDLTDLESDESWVLFNVTDGEVEMTNTSWTVGFNGDPATTVTALKLVSAKDLPADFWENASLTFTNPELRGQFAVGPDGAYLVFGNATSLPEPATWVLFLLGACFLIKFRSFKQK